MRTIGVGADAAHMVVMAGLRARDIRLIAQDLRTIFAELAVHRVLAATDLGNPVDQDIDDERMVA